MKYQTMIPSISFSDLPKALNCHYGYCCYIFDASIQRGIESKEMRDKILSSVNEDFIYIPLNPH